jgi:hypothetical protein
MNGQGETCQKGREIEYNGELRKIAASQNATSGKCRGARDQA